MEFDPKLVALFAEWDAPKTNVEPYLELMKESSKEFADWNKKGIIKDFHSWTDNTGHYMVFFLFETIEKFAEIWNEQEFHRLIGESSMFIENVKIRLMRPAAVPE